MEGVTPIDRRPSTEASLFVERLDRHGSVVERVRLTGPGLRIGRAFDNDLILDDPHVCPHHAVLELDEERVVSLRDLGSRNGTRVDGRAVERTAIAPGARLRLGRTVLRLADSREALAETVPLAPVSGPLRWLGHPVGGVLLAALLWFLGVGEAWRETYAEYEAVELWTEPALLLLVVAAWAGAWALVTRLLTGRSRFLAHWAIAAVTAVARYAEAELFGQARFVFAPIEPMMMAESIAGATIMAVNLAAHLTVAEALRPSRRVLAGACLAALLIAFDWANQVADEDLWVTTLPYWSRLEPLPTAWLPRQTPEAFFAEAAELRDALDELAAEDEELP